MTTTRKAIVTLVAAASLAGPAMAQGNTQPGGMPAYANQGIIAVLIGLLLPAVQAAREAARKN